MISVSTDPALVWIWHEIAASRTVGIDGRTRVEFAEDRLMFLRGVARTKRPCIAPRSAPFLLLDAVHTNSCLALVLASGGRNHLAHSRRDGRWNAYNGGCGQVGRARESGWVIEAGRGELRQCWTRGRRDGKRGDGHGVDDGERVVLATWKDDRAA